MVIIRESLGPWRWLWITVMLSMTLWGCAGIPLPERKVAVKPAPRPEQSHPVEKRRDEVKPLSIAPPFSINLLHREIERREEVLRTLRTKASGKEALKGIKDLRQQVEFLRELRSLAREWELTMDEEGRLKLAEKMASTFLKSLSLSPLPSIQETEPSREEEVKLPEPTPIEERTRVDWDAVREAFGHGDDLQAIEAYEAGIKALHQTQPPLDLQVKYAMALSRRGQKEQAIEVMRSVLAHKAFSLDSLRLKYLLAGWLTEEGRLDEAEALYKEVMKAEEEMARWPELAGLRLEVIKIRRSHLPEVGVPTPQVGEGGEGMPPPVEEEPEYMEEARAVPPQEVPKGSEEERLLQARAEMFKRANQLMEAERFEEAVVAFEELLGTEYEHEATKHIQEAMDRFAENKRKEAARLFLEARDIQDPEQKRAKLLRALAYLQEANTKFPRNSLAAKIEKNIQAVVREIQKVDPEFSLESTQEQ